MRINPVHLFRSATATSLTVVCAAAGAVSATAPGALPADDSVVAAQHVVELGDGPYHWVVATSDVRAAEAINVRPADPTFLAVTAGAVTVLDQTGSRSAVLGSNEADYLSPGSDEHLVGGAEGATTMTLSVVPGGDRNPGAGSHDLELRLDVVPPGEEVGVGEASGIQTLVVTDGTVTADGTEVNLGGSIELDGPATVINTGDTPAVILVGIVSGPLGLAVTATTTTTPTTTVAVSTAPTTAPGPTTTPATTTTMPADGDSDGDNISDSDEIQAGTDPMNADTDGDGLRDDEEGSQFPTDPTIADTDGDNLLDGDEVALGTDPAVNDSDGDGLDDGQEIDLGTQPLNADTDADGWSDYDEHSFYFTDPLDPNSRPAAVRPAGPASCTTTVDPVQEQDGSTGWEVNIAWEPPAFNGGSPITRYWVFWQHDGNPGVTEYVSGDTRYLTIQDASPGHYVTDIRAENAVGYSEQSCSPAAVDVPA